MIIDASDACESSSVPLGLWAGFKEADIVCARDSLPDGLLHRSCTQQGEQLRREVCNNLPLKEPTGWNFQILITASGKLQSQRDE